MSILDVLPVSRHIDDYVNGEEDDLDLEHPCRYPWWMQWHWPECPTEPPTLTLLSGAQITVELAHAVRILDARNMTGQHLGVSPERVQIVHHSGCRLSDHLPLISLEKANLTVVLDASASNEIHSDDGRSTLNQTPLSRCPRVLNMRELKGQCMKTAF